MYVKLKYLESLNPFEYFLYIFSLPVLILESINVGFTEIKLEYFKNSNIPHVRKFPASQLF